MMRLRRKKLSSYIIASCDKLLRKYPDAGVFILGDFNTLQTNCFNRHLNLVQIVNASTRGNNILDKIFTNSSRFYSPPIILSPVSKSDHNMWLNCPLQIDHGLSLFRCLRNRVNRVRKSLYLSLFSAIKCLWTLLIAMI